MVKQTDRASWTERVRAKLDTPEKRKLDLRLYRLYIAQHGPPLFDMELSNGKWRLCHEGLGITLPGTTGDMTRKQALRAAERHFGLRK